MSKFGELISAQIPVLIDFYTEWNEQSVSMHPVIRDVAAALGLAEDSPVWRLEKLRLIEGQPLLYSLEYLPLALLPPDHPVFDWSGSLMALMQGLGLAPVMSRATVSAVGPPETQADLGSLGAGGPLLLVAETCFTAAGQAVIRSLIYHAGHQFSFSFARK